MLFWSVTLVALCRLRINEMYSGAPFLQQKIWPICHRLHRQLQQCSFSLKPIMVKVLLAGPDLWTAVQFSMFFGKIVIATSGEWQRETILAVDSG